MSAVQPSFDKYGWPINPPVRATSSSSRPPARERHSSSSTSGRRENMNTLKYDDEYRPGDRIRDRLGGSREKVEGDDHHRVYRHHYPRMREERTTDRVKGDQEVVPAGLEPRRPREHSRQEEGHRVRLPLERKQGRIEIPNGAAIDDHQSTWPRTQDQREHYYPTVQARPVTQKAEGPARRARPSSSSTRPVADAHSSYYHGERTSTVEAKGKQGSRKTSVTFLPALVADHSPSRGGFRGDVAKGSSRPSEFEDGLISRPYKPERSVSTPYNGRYQDNDPDSRHDQLPDKDLGTPDRVIQEPRMRYPPVSNWPRQHVIPMLSPSTSTKSARVGLSLDKGPKGHSDFPSYMKSRQSESIDQGEPRGDVDRSGYRNDMREASTVKKQDKEDAKQITQDYDWPDSRDPVYTAAKQAKDHLEPKTNALASDKPGKSLDPYTRAHAIRKRTGYQARLAETSQRPYRSPSPTVSKSFGIDCQDAEHHPPPIPVKSRRDDNGAQISSTSILGLDECHPLELPLALREETHTAPVMVPDDPVPMYTELPVEHTFPSERSLSNAQGTGPSHAAKVPSGTPEEAEATDRMNDMEDEITCPICMSIMVAVHAVAPCGHTMCGACGSEWFRDHDKCPICRTTPTSTSTPMVPLLPMDRLIEVWVRAQGDNWEGKTSWEDRKGAWEALKIVMREEEAARTATTGATGNTAEMNPSNDPIGIGGEDEYRLREENSNPFQSFASLFSSNPFGPFTGYSYSLGSDPPNESTEWTTRFDPDDFDHSPPLVSMLNEGDEVRVPEWGVNPFMDAFGYTSRPPISPLPGQRHFSAPFLGVHHPPQPRRHRTTGLRPGGWLDGMMDLVDTFTRHHRPGGMQGMSGGSGMYGHEARARDLDGLEQGMARLFADLRGGR